MTFNYSSFDDNMDEFWLGKLSDLVSAKQGLKKSRSRTLMATLIRSTSSDYLSQNSAWKPPSSTNPTFLDTMSTCRSVQDFLPACYPASQLHSTSAIVKKAERRWEIVLPTISVARIFFAIMLIASLANMPWAKVEGPPKVSLGSAAISSFTEEFSPILPFAGGMDLRRSDYWLTLDGDWFGTLKSVAQQVNEAFVQRGEEKKQLQEKVPTLAHPTKSSKSRHPNTISAAKPFASLEQIADLTLDEVAVMFKYALESSNPEFSSSRFMSRLGPKVRRVLDQLQDAVSKSRGSVALDFVRLEPTAGEIDALKFVAATRIFAEWRMVRLVPDGYKGFAVGMSLGHKDVVQNLVKIEEATHAWLHYHRDVVGLTSPSLRDLLSFEVETGIHPANRLPRLTEKTAGMGLLWVSRQLEYQTQLFDNLIHVNRFSSSRDAILAAYKAVYDRYHGWAVQKIFSYSFQAAPEADVALQHMNPKKKYQPNVPQTESVEKADKSLIDSLFGIFSYSSHRTMQATNNSPTKELVGAAQSQITGYIDVAKPIIDNLATLFSDLNMNDPTRV